MIAILSSNSAVVMDANNDKSSQSTYDSVHSIMNLPWNTPEGIRAWTNYRVFFPEWATYHAK